MKSKASLLIRHRWVRIVDEQPQFFRCDQRSFPLYRSDADPACPGCGAVIIVADIADWPDRYGPSVDHRSGETLNTDRKLEDLGLRLDLLHEGIKLKQARGVA